MSAIDAHLGLLRQIRAGKLSPRECMQSVEFQRHATLFVASHLDELISRHGYEEPSHADVALPSEWFSATPTGVAADERTSAPAPEGEQR